MSRLSNICSRDHEAPEAHEKDALDVIPASPAPMMMRFVNKMFISCINPKTIPTEQVTTHLSLCRNETCLIEATSAR